MNKIIHTTEWIDMHTDVIEFFASKVNPNLYVELGLYKGETINRVAKHAKRSIGVDLISGFSDKNFEFFQMSTDDYLEILKKENLKIDMLFIDADHSYEQSLKDFDGYFEFVNDDGFIFMHDTYPISEKYLDKGYCGDSYKTAWHIRNNYKEKCEILTIPFHPGLSIIRKSTKQLFWM
jgi:predicted O-methyltransferase YrrM